MIHYIKIMGRCLVRFFSASFTTVAMLPPLRGVPCDDAGTRGWWRDESERWNANANRAATLREGVKKKDTSC